MFIAFLFLQVFAEEAKPKPTQVVRHHKDKKWQELERIIRGLYTHNEEIAFEELLEVFWKTHDPTTLNSQGNDFGTQYRSVIFYHSEEQKALAEKYKSKLNEAKAYENPVITEITAFTNFYPAEDYHQNYFNANGSEPYCKFVIQPKLEKFEKVFKDKIRQ